MANDERPTKLCKVCFQEIDRRAQACPHCGHWQPRGFLRNILPSLIFMGVMVAYGESIVVRARALFRPSQEAVTYSGQIVVTQSEMLKGLSAEGPTVFVVGKLRNDSDVEWEQIEIEAQFRDPQGKLIDADARRHYLEHLVPRGEMAFKVRTVADRPVEEYADYKVAVKYAQDIRRGPW